MLSLISLDTLTLSDPISSHLICPNSNLFLKEIRFLESTFPVVLTYLPRPAFQFVGTSFQ